MKCTKIRLETVRPFYMRDITLMDTDMNPNHASATEHVEAFCAEKVKTQDLILESRGSVPVSTPWCPFG